MRDLGPACRLRRIERNNLIAAIFRVRCFGKYLLKQSIRVFMLSGRFAVTPEGAVLYY